MVIMTYLFTTLRLIRLTTVRGNTMKLKQASAVAMAPVAMAEVTTYLNQKASSIFGVVY